MEENQAPPKSIEPFVVEEPQEPQRRNRAQDRDAELPAIEESVPEAPPVSADEPIKADAGWFAPVDEAVSETPAVEFDVRRASSILESLLLVSSEPLPVDKACRLLGDVSREQLEEVFLALREKYPPETSGILVEQVARGFQFRTSPANQEHVRKLFDVKPPRFSRAALETVAIIAYRQPLTRQEIESVRGVDCAGALKTLMDRRLVRVVGKKDTPGKPFLFGTTREFMEVFGLGSLKELPSMREIEEYLASSVATPVESARETLDLPFADGVAETGVAMEGDQPPQADGHGESESHGATSVDTASGDTAAEDEKLAADTNSVEADEPPSTDVD